MRPTGAPVPTLWCDLAGLSFVSVAGVVALDAARRAAHGRGVTLHLVAASRAARRMVSLTGSSLAVDTGDPDERPAVRRDTAPREA